MRRRNVARMLCLFIGVCLAADGGRAEDIKEATAMAMKLRNMPEILKGVKRILFYGDSLTDGSDYPDYVVNTLNRAFPDAGFEILNSAVCGNTAADLRKRMQADVIDRKPDLVSICIGVNDCIGKRPVADYEADMEALATAIQKAGARVLLMLPSNLGDPEREARFLEYLAVIRKVAAAHNALVADAHAEFLKGTKEGREMLGADGVHHGKNGFEGMARAVLDALGFQDVPVDKEIKPWPHMLTQWESSEPIPNKPPFDPAKATGWKPYDREAAVAKQPWWNAPFAARGGWMPFALAKPPDGSIAFGRTRYQATRAGKAELQVGGSPPQVVWLNGRQVWQGQGSHGYHPNADRFMVDLQAGPNEIVVLSNYMAFVGLREVGE